MVERLLLHQSLLHHRLLLLLLLQSLHFLGLSFDLLSLPRARKCFSWFPRRKKTKTKNREKEKKKGSLLIESEGKQAIEWLLRILLKLICIILLVFITSIS